MKETPMLQIDENTPNERWIIAYNRVCDNVKRLTTAFLEIPKLQDITDELRNNFVVQQRNLEETRAEHEHLKDNVDEIALDTENSKQLIHDLDVKYTNHILRLEKLQIGHENLKDNFEELSSSAIETAKLLNKIRLRIEALEGKTNGK